MKWLYKLTGGRPMERIGYAFFDWVAQEDVLVYRDRLGRTWLATTAWDLFRVPQEGG